MEVRSYQAIYPDYILNQGHSNRGLVNSMCEAKLTLAPYVEVGVGDQDITLKINGKPAAALSKTGYHDSRNLGPFIESLSFKIVPVANATFRTADPGGTPETSYHMTYLSYRSWTISPSGSVAPLNSFAAAGVAPACVFSNVSGSSSTHTVTDFSSYQLQNEHSIEWKKDLSICLKDREPKIYDCGNTEVIRKWNHKDRSLSFVKFKWPSDELLDVPQIAKTSIGCSTMATYDRVASRESQFKIYITARVVLASNQCQNPKSNKKGSDNTGDYLYWIKSEHQVEKTITIGADNAVASTPFTQSQKSQWGYNRRDVPNNGTKKEYRSDWLTETRQF